VTFFFGAMISLFLFRTPDRIGRGTLPQSRRFRVAVGDGCSRKAHNPPSIPEG
jgi:hypothetical protein